MRYRYEISINESKEKDISMKIKTLLFGNCIDVLREVWDEHGRIIYVDDKMHDKIFKQIEELGANIKEDEKYNQTWGC